MFNENNELDITKLQGPIPGESLTGLPGSKPWEKPPQYTDMDELLEFFWDKFNNPDFATAMFGLMKAGMPADQIARTILFMAFTRGVCTVDMCLLALPTVIRQLVAIGHFMGLKDIKIKSPNKKNQDLLAGIAKLSEAENAELPEEKQEEDIFAGLGL